MKQTLRSKVYALLYDRGLSTCDMERGCGVARQTVYRGVKCRSVLAALAYFFGMTVEELVKDTEAEEIWEYGKEEL